jgi:hypothetical protein
MVKRPSAFAQLTRFDLVVRIPSGLISWAIYFMPIPFLLMPSSKSTCRKTLLPALLARFTTSLIFSILPVRINMHRDFLDRAKSILSISRIAGITGDMIKSFKTSSKESPLDYTVIPANTPLCVCKYPLLYYCKICAKLTNAVNWAFTGCGHGKKYQI